MGQSVQRRRGEERIAEEVGPLGGRPVTREEQTPPFIALANDLVQVVHAGRREGAKTEVVQDEQITGVQLFEDFAIRGVGARREEVGQQHVQVACRTVYPRVIAS